MWRERSFFLSIGLLVGALCVWLARGAVRPEGGVGSDASAATLARLERRIAELEADARRPTELAAAPPPGTSDRAAMKDRSRTEAAPPTPDDRASVAGAGEGGKTPKPAIEWFRRAPTVSDGGAPVTFSFGDGTTAEPPPDWTPTETEDRLRFGTAEEKAKALAVLRAASKKEYLPVAQRALDTGPDEATTRSLMDSIARLKDRPWSALQATGAPDVPIAGDFATAWASKGPDMGEVTLDLTYDRAVRVDRVRIHETNAAGAIARILAKAPDGTWDVLWEGRAPASTTPNWFAPTLASTRYATTAIRLVVDTDRVPDWNEIDAVELEGDGIRQWASGATASSSYADR